MNDKAEIRIIDSPERIKEALLLLRRLAITPGMFNPEFLMDKGWAAVPVESASHFDSQDASRLVPAMNSLGAADCLAIVTDEVSQGPLVYRVSVTEEGLINFSKEFFGLNGMLVSDNESFSVLCAIDDYYVVAGPRNFVATAVGGCISAAREAFLSFASNAAWPADVRSFLVNIASAYSAFEG